MKKSLLLLATALMAGSAFAQHYEWTAAQLPANKFASKDDAVAAGYQTMWVTDGQPINYLGMPAQNLIENEQIVVSLPAAYNYVSIGNNKYSGAEYTYKIIMGMNNSTRDGIDPSKFVDGMSEDYIRKAGDSDQGNVINDTYLKISIPATGAYGRLTFKTNRGGNLGVLYVVDQTKQQQVLLSASRCPDENVTTHIASINVQPGHDYYAFASEKGSVELYAIEYDILSSDNYEILVSEENSTSFCTVDQLPSAILTKDEAVTAGFMTMWVGEDNMANYMGIPAQNLIKNEGIEVSLPCAFSYVSKGNNKYSGANYAYKLIMGMNNSTRDGIDPEKFINGIQENPYVRKAGNADQDANVEINDAIVKISVPATGTYGRVILNTNRGGNLGVLYVVDATKSQQIVLSASRCPDETIKTHATIFNVQPGHDYYVIASEKGSVELYAIGYCETSSEKYGALEKTTTGIAAIQSAPAKDNIMYNILGQRVTNAKGIVIMNGRKMIIK